LLNLIGHLPRNSFFSEALATDEELAASMADQESPPFEQRFSEWAPEAEILAAVYEQLQVVVGVLVKAHGGDPRKVVRWPRPKSAVTAVREGRRFEAHHRLVRRLVPDR
jgi:hypothetical protein